MHCDAPIFRHYDMSRYGRPSVSRFTWNYLHRYSWKGLIKAHTFFLIRLTEILWYNSSKSRFGSTSSSCSSKYSIHWSSRLCTVLLITGVSDVMLLMTLWHLTVFTYVSRYVLYRDLCIEIRIVSWGTRIITPRIINITVYKNFDQLWIWILRYWLSSF